jgi:hypothetical protein
MKDLDKRIQGYYVQSGDALYVELGRPAVKGQRIWKVFLRTELPPAPTPASAAPAASAAAPAPAASASAAPAAPTAPSAPSAPSAPAPALETKKNEKEKEVSFVCPFLPRNELLSVCACMCT